MKLKPKDIAIIILIALLIILSFTLFIREGINLNKQKNLSQSYLEKVRQHEITLTNFIMDYYTLWRHFQTFSVDYQKQKNLLNKMEVANETLKYMEYKGEFIATAYTSEECGFITKLGVDLRENYSRYFNIAAVDPKIIPLGSQFLVEIDNQIYPFIAVDTGGAIQGKEIDIYLRIPHSEAVKFGRQKVNVWVLDNKKFEWSY